MRNSGCIVLRLTSRLAGSIEKIFHPAHDGQGWCGFCSVCKRPLQAIRKVVFALFVLLRDFGMSHAWILDLVPDTMGLQGKTELSGQSG